MIEMENYVWCDCHGEIHEKTTNPYDGPPHEHDEEGKPIWWTERPIMPDGSIGGDYGCDWRQSKGKKRVPLSPQVDPTEFYFGNLDFNHITLSKGLIHVHQMDPEGRAVVRTDIPSLQTIHEEASGDLLSYSAAWTEMQVLGIY